MNKESFVSLVSTRRSCAATW